MSNLATRAIEEIGKVIIGKDHIIRQVMTAILANGHILIEDIPGVGKTTLAIAFSKVLGLDYQRIQSISRAVNPLNTKRGRPSPTFSWQMRSTGLRPRPSRLSLKPWRKEESP